MHTRERIVVHGLLVVLLALNAVTFFSGGNDPAVAHATGPAWIPESLGPAEALLLSGDKAELKLVNREGRVAWGDDASARAYSLGFVHVGRVLDVLGRDRFAEENESLDEELRTEEADFRRRLGEISGRLSSLDQESDEFKRLYEEGEGIYQSFMEWSQEAARRREKLAITQLESAYRELVTAVEVVADRRHIDIVLRFIPTGDQFESETFESAMNEVRLRTALRSPEGIDITSDVMRELNLRDN